ncbi:hypothetical protein [Afipia sp. DC4300-2b1]
MKFTPQCRVVPDRSRAVIVLMAAAYAGETVTGYQRGADMG